MYSFYFFLWLGWAIRVTLCSTFLALACSIALTTTIYANQGFPTLNAEVYSALLAIVLFCFPLVWSVTLLLALFRSLKYIFNKQIHGYMMTLLDCSSKETIVNIGYGNLVKVWRKWFMVIIWLIGTQMLIGLFFTYLLSSYESVFEWFSIYVLFAFVLVSGFFSFVLLGGRCKKVKVIKC